MAQWIYNHNYRLGTSVGVNLRGLGAGLSGQLLDIAYIGARLPTIGDEGVAQRMLYGTIHYVGSYTRIAPRMVQRNLGV